MSDDAVEVVRLRNHFYRDNYRRVVVALLLCMTIIIVLAGIIFYMVTHRPHPVYFATTADGRIVKLKPLIDPAISDQALLQWANRAAVAAYSYNYVNYREALTNVSDYFTNNGWRQFVAELQQSNNLKAIKARKLIMSAVATGSPHIIEHGRIGKHYAWKVELPMLVSLQGSGNQLIQQALNIHLLIMRESRLDYPDGIAIAQFVAEQRVGS